MSYLSDTLTPNEKVVHRARYSLIILLKMKIFRLLTTVFVITNKRIIYKHGFIFRRTFEMNLAKVETVQIKQGIIARLFNYGTLVIIGSGGTKEVVEKISAPLTFRSKVQEALDVK